MRWAYGPLGPGPSFYHDCQGCVKRATDRAGEDPEVVIYYCLDGEGWPSDEPDARIEIVGTGHTLESFLRRCYLESHAGWQATDSSPHRRDPPMDRIIKAFSEEMRDFSWTEVGEGTKSLAIAREGAAGA